MGNILNGDILARPKEVKIGLLFLTTINILLLILSPSLYNLFYRIIFPKGYTGEAIGGANFLGFFPYILIVANLLVSIIVSLYTNEKLDKRIRYGISTSLHGILVTGIAVILWIFLSPH